MRFDSAIYFAHWELFVFLVESQNLLFCNMSFAGIHHGDTVVGASPESAFLIQQQVVYLCLLTIGCHERFKLQVSRVGIVCPGAEQSVSPGSEPGFSHLVECNVVEVDGWGIVLLFPFRVFDAIDEDAVSLGANPGSAPCVDAVAIYTGTGLQHLCSLLGLGIEEVGLVVAGADGEFVGCHLTDVADMVAPFMFALWLHLDKLGVQFLLLHAAEHAVAASHPYAAASVYEYIEQKVGMEERVFVLYGELLQGIVFRVVNEESAAV